MALNFPTNPTVGQTYQSWRWDGEIWANNVPTTIKVIRIDPPITVQPGNLVPAGIYVRHASGSAQHTLTFSDNSTANQAFASFAPVFSDGVSIRVLSTTTAQVYTPYILTL
jgi:hypothetical protein